MDKLLQLFANNRAWVAKKIEKDPEYFSKKAKKQTPKYLWIGCSDSRVPASQIVGLEPGEIFVHRNIANLVPHTDFNCLSVIEYAVKYLQVEHIIVCGHYGCGGVQAAMSQEKYGLVDNWLRNIRDVAAASAQQLLQLDEEQKFKKLVELNVQQQVLNVCHTTIVQQAWSQGHSLSVHGWVYDLAEGTLYDLKGSINHPEQIHKAYVTENQESAIDV